MGLLNSEVLECETLLCIQVDWLDLEFGNRSYCILLEIVIKLSLLALTNFCGI